jgi:cell division protease FtsH
MNRNWRGYSLWLLAGAVILVLWMNTRTSLVERDITYSEFKHRLHDNAIQSVVVRPDQIRGKSRGADGKEENFRTIPLNDPGLVDDLERSKVHEYSADVDHNWLGAILINLGPMLLFLFFWFLMMRQMQGGGKQAMAFGRSKAKLQSAKKSKITFADVAGCDEAKVELQEIIEFLKDPAKFQRLGGKIPKGVLLYGAPGTGKTLLAKAVAGEAGVPFFSASGSEFVEMFVGVGASRVRDLFDQGRRNAPCLLFIDEIDAVGRHRFAGIGGGHDEREQTLNQLLVEMDGFDTKEGVILIAATNRPDVLDPALLRPGRFDRHITVPRPDLNGREQILTVHAKSIKMGPDADLRSVARGTPGYVGADLANIMNEAALLAARRNKPYVEKSELSEAVERVGAGPERRSLKITDSEKRVIAYHESGHAMIARMTPGADPVHRVTIIPRGPALGYMRQVPEDRQLHTVTQLKSQIAVALGGREAEALIFKEVTGGACSDIEKATELATRMVCEWGMSEKLGPMSFTRGSSEVFMGRDIGREKSFSDDTAQMIDSEVKRFIIESQTHVRELLTQNLVKLNRLAERLMERETLDGDELDAILNEGDPIPAAV